VGDPEGRSALAREKGPTTVKETFEENRGGDHLSLEIPWANRQKFNTKKNSKNGLKHTGKEKKLWGSEGGQKQTKSLTAVERE